MGQQASTTQRLRMTQTKSLELMSHSHHRLQLTRVQSQTQTHHLRALANRVQQGEQRIAAANHRSTNSLRIRLSLLRHRLRGTSQNVIRQQNQKLLLILHVVVQGAGSHVKLLSKSAHGKVRQTVGRQDLVGGI